MNEYSHIQAAIRDDLRTKIVQTLVSVFLKSDQDDNFIIDPEEVDRMVLRLKNIPSVEFHEEKFRRVLQKEGGDIGNFVERHLNGDVDHNKEGMFVF